MKRLAVSACIGSGLMGLAVLAAMLLYFASPARQALAGSISCRECHEQFYELWSTSHHGLAMQPYTVEFARQNLMPTYTPVQIGETVYVPCIEGTENWILEQTPNSQMRHRIAHVMGGRNVYYFLTPMKRGRLQTLPIAYDVRTGPIPPIPSTRPATVATSVNWPRTMTQRRIPTERHGLNRVSTARPATGQDKSMWTFADQPKQTRRPKTFGSSAPKAFQLSRPMRCAIPAMPR